MSYGLEFQKVSKRYGGADAPLVVKAINLTVPTGTLTTLLGPSGCGKTTTLRLIAGLESASAGRILIDGRDVTHLGAAERNVSMVFQSYALFPHMDVLANVGYGLMVSGVSQEETRRRARNALEGVGLTGFEARSTSELSGGQQQRVAVARALVLEPAVMLFDEPLSNLDATLRRSMRQEIRALQQRLKLTVAYVTHDQAEAMAVSDQIVVMEAGRVAQAGTPRQLYEQPCCEFVAGFMGEALLLDAVADDHGQVRLGPLLVPVRQAVAPGPVKLAVRPEAWQLGPAGAGGLVGQVSKSAYLGHGQELSLDTALGPVLVVVAGDDERWQVGQQLSLNLGSRGVSVVGVPLPASGPGRATA